MTTIYASEGGSNPAPLETLFIDIDSGDITIKRGAQSIAAGGGGSIADATTSAIGGVEVDHARSGAHSVALTTDGLALPAGMIGTTSSTACAGDDARLSDARRPLGSLVTVTDDYTVLTTDHTILVAASGKTITLPDPASVPADTEFRIKNTPAGDTTVVEPPQVPPPATPGPSFTQSGGTVADGVYTVAVSYTNALGETVASSSATVTAAGDPDADTSTLVIQSPDPATGATGWNAYLSQVGGSDLTLQNVTPTDIGTDLTLTAPPTSGGVAPPVSSTASIASIDGAATYTGLTGSKAAATFVSNGFSDFSIF